MVRGRRTALAQATLSPEDQARAQRLLDGAGGGA